MRELRQGRQTRTNNDRQYNRNNYIYGNTALQPDIRRELDASPKKKLSANARKNREKAIHMNLPYVIFLAGAICVSGFILVNYLQLQADITNGNAKLTQMESEYLNMKADNDEELTRINNAVDIQEIERIAREELGMHYATEGQVISYTDEMSDYVKQYGDIE